MTKIYLVRHGETEWNRDGRYQGALDSPLTERGIEQAGRIGMCIAAHPQDWSAVYVSPLGRARQTHALVAAHLGSTPVRYDDRLCEVSAGSWDGLSLEELDAEWPAMLDGSSQFDWYFRSPDGESYDAAMTRVSDWLADVDGTVLAVSHGLVGRLIRGAYLGLPREEVLQLPVPQDIVWVLGSGRVSPLGNLR
ncbi:MAG TPA: histidine phosphatase family protein [Croceibacterium sp.]|nr:histidine phosphatase family protein [Croceibacterium sp.]